VFGDIGEAHFRVPRPAASRVVDGKARPNNFAGRDGRVSASGDRFAQIMSFELSLPTVCRIRLHDYFREPRDIDPLTRIKSPPFERSGSSV
jgi:hypothetical protein